MTRRGSVAYYLASWVCGCTFIGILVWIASLFQSSASRATGLLFVVISLSLMSGAVASLLFGFFLRRTANGLHWNCAWQWVIGGAIIAPLLIALLGAIASPNAQGSGWRGWLFSSLSGAYMINGGHNWKLSLLAAPAGAATAWVLFRIDRAFSKTYSETTP